MPPTSRKEVIEESDSEEIIIRHSSKKKLAESAKSARAQQAQDYNHAQSIAPTHRSKGTKPLVSRSASPDSLTTFAAESIESVDEQFSTEERSRPRIVRRLVYRYVPDLERMASRQAANDQTEIVLEETPDRPHMPRSQPRRNAVEVIASHPGAWSHGKMVQVDKRIEEEYSTESSTDTEDDKVNSTEPPQWYFRRYTRRTAPFPTEDQGVRSGPPSHANSKRDDDGLTGDSQRPARKPMRSILQPSAPPPRRPRQYEDDWQDEEDTNHHNDQHSRVSFAPGTKRGGRRTAVPCTPAPAQARKAWDLGQEALRDSVEAEIDRAEEKRVRSRARHEIAKDGGAYMELDGHCSDDQGG